ncbi:solute carrier family 23 member 3 isoform X3 [Alligator mississippiensis]|uniref:solute carrier family 23 member 3 isoform X3 n=1 Tax=Alligator mississippiensis TaxID=8496 RepID=UPI00090765CA|nr:solute carrier family 23 member 3 isoform X3 [Alligator mississippiensis]
MPGGCCQGPHAPPLPAAPTDRPPWALSCAFALQHVAVQASLLCVFHLLLLPTFPPADPDLLLDPSRDRGALLAQSLFACGASSMLQTVLGTRLPLLHVPTFEFLIPAVVLSTRLPHPGSNGTDTPAPCTGPSCSTGGWDRTAREVSGAVVVAGLVQLALGLSGAGGWAARHCGPLVLAPTLSIMGLSAYKPAAAFCSASWSLALLLVLLAVLCSQHLGSCRLPRCTETRTPGFPVGTAIPALRRFSVLLPFAIAWLVCGVLAQLHVPWAQLSPVLPNATTPPPWLQLPYPGWLTLPGAAGRAGLPAPGPVAPAGRAPHPHPTAHPRQRALRDLRSGGGRRDLLLPARRHRLRPQRFRGGLHHVHGALGAALARRRPHRTGHRLGGVGRAPALAADGAGRHHGHPLIRPGEHCLGFTPGAGPAPSPGAGERTCPGLRAPACSPVPAWPHRPPRVSPLLPLPPAGGGGGWLCRGGRLYISRGSHAPPGESWGDGRSQGWRKRPRARALLVARCRVSATVETVSPWQGRATAPCLPHSCHHQCPRAGG